MGIFFSKPAEGPITAKVKTLAGVFNIKVKRSDTVGQLLKEVRAKVFVDNLDKLVRHLKTIHTSELTINKIIQETQNNPESLTNILKNEEIYVFNNDEMRYAIKGKNGKEKSSVALKQLKNELLKIGLPENRCISIVKNAEQEPGNIYEILCAEKIFCDGKLLADIENNNACIAKLYPSPNRSKSEEVIPETTMLKNLLGKDSDNEFQCIALFTQESNTITHVLKH